MEGGGEVLNWHCQLVNGGSNGQVAAVGVEKDCVGYPGMIGG